MSYTTRNMFDGLDVQDSYHYEEDVEETVEEPETTAAAAPLSKGAKKRAAKAARAAAAAAESATETASQGVAAVTAAVNGKPKAAESKAANGSSATPASSSAEKGEGAGAPATEALLSAVETVDEAVAPEIKKVERAASSASQSITAPAPALSKRAESPSSPPASTSFKPSLPSNLPHPPSANELPANRKRKTPQDFTPAGPNDAQSFASPNKNSVKFEDGVVPGEGRDGEKTITPVVVKEIKKNQNAIERTVWTLIMIFGFISLLCLGHPYMIILVLICQALVYKEVTALFNLRDHGVNQIKDGEKGDPWSKTLNWYFFVVTNYFLYGESIIYYFKHIVFVDAYFTTFAKNHRFISFMLYVIGFVGFVANLQRQYLRQQFALFCWVHITLLLTVVSSHFIVNNILEGLIWFFVPASLVVNNDVMAYICGKFFGRTPLIKLSPKKTVEGFVGAFILTLIFGICWGTFFMRFDYMVCPAKDLGVNAFSSITCKRNPVFLWHTIELTGLARTIAAPFGLTSIQYAPFQYHCLVMATFASLVAPFGGFFASGFKRAFNIKDFGHSIPGHGGMTDRMDCQFMMGLFAYVYYSSLIRIQQVSVGSLLQTAVTALTADEQLELIADLRRFLEGQGIKA